MLITQFYLESQTFYGQEVLARLRISIASAYQAA